MFTGIIQELGTVQRLEVSGSLYRLEIACKVVCDDVKIGGSVAINGVCLTVAEKKQTALCFDVMAETMRRTDLARLKNGDKVNVENSLKANGALGGHFVLGHVDCAGIIKDAARTGDGFAIEVEFPREFSRLVVEKGSIAIDGVSLTVGECGARTLKVYLIPHTLKSTTLGSKKVSDAVNLEFDIIGKYVSKFNDPGANSRVTESFLHEKGF